MRGINYSRETWSTLRSRETRHLRYSWFFYLVRPTSSFVAVYCRVLTSHRWREVPGRLARWRTEGFSFSLAPSFLHDTFEAATVVVPEVASGTCLKTCDGNAKVIIRGWLRFLSRSYGNAHGIFYKNAYSERSRHSLFTAARIRRVYIHVSTILVDRNFIVCAAMISNALCSHSSFAKVSAQKSDRRWFLLLVQQSGKFILFRDKRVKLQSVIDAIGHAF